MSEKPPPYPADRSEDFARRYAEDLDIMAGQVMRDIREEIATCHGRRRS